MASFTTSNGNTTVKFEYTTTNTKMQAIISDAAEKLWENDDSLNPFSEATNQEKLDIVDEFVKESVIRLANDFKSQKAQKEAKETEEETEYEL